MAIVQLLQGLSTDLETLNKVAGQVLFCTDTKEIYLDVIPATEDGTVARVRLYDGYDADITALKGLVGETPVVDQIKAAIGELKIGDETFATVKAYVDKKTDGIATDTALENLTKRVTTAEADIDTLEGNVENLMADADVTNSVANQIKTAITTLKALTILAVSNIDNSIEVQTTTVDGGKAANIKVKRSAKTGNQLQLLTGEGEQGLYVPAPEAAPEYTIEKASTAETGFASTYKLMKDGTQVGASINIAKDKFLKAVTLVDTNDEGKTGKYIKMEFEDDTNSVIYLNVYELVDVYTGAETDTIIVAVNETTNKITATIKAGSITKTFLATAVQTSLDKADSAVQKDQVIEGTVDGAITVQGEIIKVHGLKSAAYQETTAFDTAGAASGVQNTLTGVAGDDLKTQLTLNALKNALTWGTF